MRTLALLSHRLLNILESIEVSERKVMITHIPVSQLKKITFQDPVEAIVYPSQITFLSYLSRSIQFLNVIHHTKYLPL